MTLRSNTALRLSRNNRNDAAKITKRNNQRRSVVPLPSGASLSGVSAEQNMPAVVLTQGVPGDTLFSRDGYAGIELRVIINAVDQGVIPTTGSLNVGALSQGDSIVIRKPALATGQGNVHIMVDNSLLYTSPLSEMRLRIT